MPLVRDPDVLPLYVDADYWSSIPLREDSAEVAQRRGFVREDTDRAPIRLSDLSIAHAMQGRHSFAVAQHHRVSFGTYFNAFPASYWAKWTSLDAVRLSITTSGSGSIHVYRSNARGVILRVDSATVAARATSDFDLPLTNFGDGGWYWFDLVADDADFRLDHASWLAAPGLENPRRGTVSLAITTLNRTSFLLPMLATLAADDVLELIDRIYVVDQGSEKVREAQGFAELEESFGGKLRVIEQDNLGGSGGFSRGMYETLRAGESDYVLLLDDDVAVEPESIRRLLTFSDYSKVPTIVGGHMFDLYDKSRLHAFAEGFDMTRFMWGASSPTRHDFSASNLRQTKWLHRRLDAQYNGWWMCLIPVDVVREIGLSVPVFIKWDDAEYGLRAAEHGVPTVSLPGAALWHVSWIDKDDSIDWQAFYHARNRLVAALLHSPRARGGALIGDNFALDTKYLVNMQYFAMAARLEAYRSVLAGPTELHDDLRTRLSEVRGLLDEYPDGRAIRPGPELMHVPVESAVEEGRWAPNQAPRGRARLVWLAKVLAKNVLRGASRDQHSEPTAHLPYEDARWWVVPHFDSVYVTNAEGTGVLWYRRDRATFLRMMRESWRLRRTLRRRWPQLAAQYREAADELVSAERWATTFSDSTER